MAEELKLRVRNVMGIAKADITLQGIVLAAGHNAAGKSSLLEAAACAITGSPLARGQATKRAAAALLRRGAQAGSITLDYGVGSVRVVYPDCTVDQIGKPQTFGTGLGIGSIKFMSLRPEDRAREIADRFQVFPTRQDLLTWLRTQETQSGLERADQEGQDEATQALDAVWGDIETSGWDAVAKRMASQATKIKAKWELRAGTKWGDKKAALWAPPGIVADDDNDEEAERAAYLRHREQYERLVVHERAAGLDRDRLQQTAQRVSIEEAEITRIKAEAEQLSAKVDELITQRKALHTPGLPDFAEQQCPHCQQLIAIRRDAKGYLSVDKPPPRMPDAEIKALRMQIANLDGSIEHARNAVNDNERELIEASARLRQALQAQQQLAVLDETRITLEQISNARAAMDRQEARMNAVVQYLEARGIYEDWRATEALVRALEPDGVRASVMERKMSEINATLGKYCAAAKIPEIQLLPNMEVTYDRNPYALLSESERWRVDFVLSVLLAQQEKSAVLLVDRLDILHPQARPGILAVLHSLRMNALIAMTAKDVQSVPDLQKTRIGVVVWIEAGVVGAAA